MIDLCAYLWNCIIFPDQKISGENILISQWKLGRVSEGKKLTVKLNLIRTKLSKGEIKMEATDSPNAENDSILAFLAPFLVYPVAADDTPPYELIAWWKVIFSYLGIKKKRTTRITMDVSYIS